MEKQKKTLLYELEVADEPTDKDGDDGDDDYQKIKLTDSEPEPPKETQHLPHTQQLTQPRHIHVTH